MLTKKQELKAFILRQTWAGKKYIKTSEIAKWGVDNYSNRAMRNARELAFEDVLKRVPKDEAVLLGLTNGRESVWEILI